MNEGMNLVAMAQATDKFQEQMDSMARRMVSQSGAIIVVVVRRVGERGVALILYTDLFARP